MWWNTQILKKKKIQVAKELSEEDKGSWLQFCNEFLDLVKNNSNILNTLLTSDEAHFHVSGYDNKQNCCYWALNNPHELHQCPLHSTKVTLWYEVYSHGIISPYFLENEEGRTVTVHAERYSHAGNISAQWVTSLSTRFAVVPTRWSNCSHSRNFHASLQDNFSGHTHF